MIAEAKRKETTEDLDRLYSVVTISADMIFEYHPESEIFRFFKREGYEFTEIMSFTGDFEQFFKEKNVVFVDDIDTFERLCDNIKSGIDRANFEARIRLNNEDEYNWYRIKMRSFRDEEGHFIKVIGNSRI